jgi:phage N-6-adenine-methyltransferase
MKPPKTLNGKNDEWYTPLKYVEAAEKVMGGIDLDPASNSITGSYFPARSYYTKEDDALGKMWEGRIWLNPPYSQPLLSLFVDKFISELENGRLEQGVVLTHSNTDTKWWHTLANKAGAICFTRGRIKFISPSETKGAGSTHGQTFFYFGNETGDFEKVFSEHGLILRRPL